jgi:hypothetical protein
MLLETSSAGTLWEGALDLDEPEGEAASRGGRSGDEVGDVDPADLPAVKVEQPVTWRVLELYQPDDLSREIRALLDHNEFFLVRFGCTFRPRSPDVTIEWARVVIRLHPDEAERQPVTFAVSPTDVRQKVEREVHVSLAPTLSFNRIQATLGSAEVGLKYDELIPLVVASAAGGPLVSWDFETAHGNHVVGGKYMDVVVRAPAGTSAGRASLDVEATISSRGRGLAAVIRRRKSERGEPLDATLW